MTRKFYQKLGPYNKDGEEGKDINPNKARNWVITWYTFVLICVVSFLIFSN